MQHFVAIWVDHNEARALALSSDDASFDMIAHVHAQDLRTHPKKNDGSRHEAEPSFLAAIASIIERSDEVVLVGPSRTKDELVAYLETSHADLCPRIVAVETLDRESDGRIAAHARKVFERTDRMRGIHVEPRN
jgi:stalled ribosome rescue protein Dom34